MDTSSQSGNIPRAILLDNKFSIEWTNDYGGVIKLQTKNGIDFFGQFEYIYEKKLTIGKMNAKFYSNEEGCILIGHWFESDTFFTLIELKKVAKFEDKL